MEISTENIHADDPGQRAIDRMQRLAGMILDVRPPTHRISYSVVPIIESPEDFEHALQNTRAGSLMLQAGESFALDGGEERYGSFDLMAGDAQAGNPTVLAESQRFSDGGWICHLEAGLNYNKGSNTAVQSIALEASASKHQPMVYRKIWAPYYAETGYERHGFKKLEDGRPEDAEELMDMLEPRIAKVVKFIKQKQGRRS